MVASLAVSDLELIDSVCDEFEAKWIAGDRPTIEPYVASHTQPLRGHVLRAILLVQLEYLRDRGETVIPAALETQFPDCVDIIRDTFRQWEQEQEHSLPSAPQNLSLIHI